MSDRSRGFGPFTRLRPRAEDGRLVEHRRLVDVLVAAAVAVPVFVPFATAPVVTPLGVVFNLGTVVPLVWRRRAPFAVALVVACFAMAVSLHHRPGQMLQYGALVAIYTLADLGRHRWQRWGFIGALVASTPPGALLIKGNDAGEFMFTLLLPMTAFLLGTLARTARERSDALVARSVQLEREREAEAARAAAEERARIARDMHDVLAHAVSIMVVQAEAGPVVVRTDPDRAEQAFDAIAGAGRDALAQLRRMLGVLKEDQDHGVRAPQPTIAALPALVEHVNGTRVDVRLTVEGVARDLYPDADLAAYRIVQEALTNTVKHSGARAAEVRLRWTDHGLEITVTDDGQGHDGQGSDGQGSDGQGSDGEPGWRRGGEPGWRRAAIAAVDEHDPDVVLLDIRMPGLDGIEAAKAVCARSRTRAIMLTTFDQDDYVYDALYAGASGFLLKDVRRDDLVHAVRVVSAGESLLAPAITRRLISDITRNRPRGGTTASERLSVLTGRERETLRLLGRGLSNAEIAAAMVVSEHTVKTHVSNVLAKLGIRDRVQAVIAAYETRLIEPS